MTENIHDAKPGTRARASIGGGVVCMGAGIVGFFVLERLSGFLGDHGAVLLLTGLIILGFVGIFAGLVSNSDAVAKNMADTLGERVRFLQEKGVRASGPVVAISELSNSEGESTIEIGVDVGGGKRAAVRLRGSAVVLPRKGDTIDVIYDPNDPDVAIRVGEEPPENVL